MSRPLTAAALKNLEAGNTTGAGTSTCRSCKGDKEISRLNSATCRSCGGKAERETYPADPMRLLRTSVAPEVFAALQDRAADREVSLAVLVREIVTEHVEATEDRSILASPTQDVWPLTQERWRACKAWCRANRALYDSCPKTNDAHEIYAWALENGFKP